MNCTRREWLSMSLAAAGLGAAACSEYDSNDGWHRGGLNHLLPTASAHAFNIKLSFMEPMNAAPILHVGERKVEGQRQDSAGRFWAFRVGGLRSGTEYSLQLRRSGTQETLCDSWPLRTLPASDDQPPRLRIISYTCAGGPNVPIPPAIYHAFKPAAYRRRLFDLILEEKPDLVIANGDHVYFDLPMMDRLNDKPIVGALMSLVAGMSAIFDPALPVLGTANESALTSVGDDQIAQIYGVRFRSTPIFFITDDHDYFDNDDATPERVTFPPDAFHASLRNSLQKLYFPEFIEEPALPEAIPGRITAQGLRLSTYFGEVRYGDLFCGLFYDCGGFLSLGDDAGLVPASVERWLANKTRREDTAHLVHFPSHPMGWSAGKWREWYPDLLTSRGSLVEGVQVDDQGQKFQWQDGWWQQHQRLLRALSDQSRRKPLIVSGDLHALGIARIEASGGLDFSDNPIYSVLSGPVGVGDIGWPSRARGVEPITPAGLKATSLLDLEERNGFSVLDFRRDRIDLEVFRCPAGYVSPSQLTLDSAARIKIA
ncbi:MAG: hypothetical protein VCB25_10385 [Myxococcota bacterium]